MSCGELGALLAGENRLRLPLGDGSELRLLSAREVLEAAREADGMAMGDRERALCSNACLLARAVVRDGERVFCSGEEALEKLRLEEISSLSRQWAEFNRRENPSAQDGEERVQSLKKAWSTRLMSALSGACSAVLGRCPPRRRQKK